MVACVLFALLEQKEKADFQNVKIKQRKNKVVG